MHILAHTYTHACMHTHLYTHTQMEAGHAHVYENFFLKSHFMKLFPQIEAFSSGGKTERESLDPGNKENLEGSEGF